MNSVLVLARGWTDGLVRALVALVVLGFVEGPAAAQQREVVIEAGASQILPPSGSAGSAARFLVGGLRGAWTSSNGSGILGSVQAGQTTDAATGGDFVSGEVLGSAWLGMGTGWSVGLRGRALGFWVGSPFPYRAGAVEGGPSLLFLRPNLSFRVDGVGGVGRSRIEFETTTPTDEYQWDGPWTRDHHMGGLDPVPDSVVVTALDADLWRYGAAAELLARLGPVVAGAAGGVHQSAGGSFRSAGLRLMGSGQRLVVGARVDSWWTPYGRESTGGVWMSLTVGGGWDVRSFVGKTEPDPLTLAASSGGGGGVMVGRRLMGRSGRGGAAPLHETLRRTPSGATIRFNVRTAATAQSVQLLGDFTLWEPRAMERDGEEWTVELEVAEGLYHFGFLVDGEWFVPDKARDTVPDEWGRQSATLLVERRGAR